MKSKHIALILVLFACSLCAMDSDSDDSDDSTCQTESLWSKMLQFFTCSGPSLEKPRNTLTSSFHLSSTPPLNGAYISPLVLSQLSRLMDSQYLRNHPITSPENKPTPDVSDIDDIRIKQDSPH